jgi:hypothetical protein
MTMRRMATALCAVALAATVAACGSSASPTTSTTAQTQARLDLAKCMRAHGINVPDPGTGGGIAGGRAVFKALQGYSRTQLQSALSACRQYVSAAFPRANLSPAQRQQIQRQLVKFAECMRSHGVNVPDPTFNNNGGPGLGFGFARPFRNIDRNSPAFQAAATACASLRPRFGRGAGGPGGPGGPPGGANA